MKLDRTLLLGLFLCLASIAFAQSVQLQILDSNTDEPVSDAFVFIASTSIGSSSDEQGLVELNLQGLGQVELVFSHLSYELKSLIIKPGDAIPTTVYLQSQTLDIDEVVVKSSASEKRAQWMRQFEYAFLGPLNIRNKVKIENPKVLLFREDEAGLTAEAMDYIDVANESLGYRLRFYLDTFLIDTLGDVRYAGKVFFQEAMKKKGSKRISRARGRAFRNGKEHFFRWLTQDAQDRNSKTFTIGKARLNEATKQLDYQKIAVENLQLTRGLWVDTLMIEDYLVVTDPRLTTRAPIWSLPFRLRRRASSMLRSKSGEILISRSGEILNPQDIEEYGHWTAQRVGELMPLDFDFSFDVISEEPAVAMVTNNRLVQYLDTLPQEKIFLHLNKPYYSNREMIHYKGYLVDAFTHLPQTQSQVIYVELINPAGEVLISQQLHLAKGLEGSIPLDKGYLPGQYQIRAYTHYMRNFDPGFFYQQAVGIFDPFLAQTATAQKDSIEIAEEDQVQEVPSVLTIDFFPEGGNLVSGLRSKVSFKLRDREGRAVNLEIRLLDDLQQELLTTTALHQGIGVFSLQPEAGRSYWVKTHFEGQDLRFPLPKAMASGYVMKVNNNREDRLYIELAASRALSLDGAFLLGHVRGQTFCLVDDLSEEEPVVLDKTKLPVGLAHFTLFNAQGRPVAERLVFNANPRNKEALVIKQPYSHFFPRQKVELQLDLKMKQFADLSATVVDQGVVQFDDNVPNSKSWLLLNADLAGQVPNASYYLEDPIGLRQLDLMLMTYGWRRFKWTDLEQLPPTDYPAEQGFHVQGYTTKKGVEEKRIQADVMLSALSDTFYADKLTTDPAGNFSFANLPQLDSTDFIIQGQIYNPKRKSDELKMNGKRQVEFHFVERGKPNIVALPPVDPILPSLAWNEYAVGEMQQDSLRNADWVIDLEEVTVTENRGTDIRIFNVYNIDEMDWIPPNRSAFSLLSTLKPGTRFRRDISTGVLSYFLHTPRGYVQVPLRFVIDGIVVTANIFETLTADLINYISINPPIISIYTRRNGPRSWQTRIQDGILNFTHPAYHQAREFYQPSYGESRSAQDKADLRTAIHWEPNIEFNADGRAVLSFYTADTPSTYEVRIEGIQLNGEPVSQQYTFEVKE
ncbi:MAG: carboxypeptidase-like regulatory domain-containing protein [Saprospiraceae bacterium]|nr:carboxypeptidase-like regulatory domain-containing protein [Saprospiraceae bacterium]